MTTASESEVLTRVGPGTPMGQLMREYWIPAALSSEVAQDGPPLRLMLLGEQLIAWRDEDGRVGIMDHRCPHRCASLYFGRKEPGGLRCAYHGWKFDVDGRCTDMPNLPADQDFHRKVRAKAYRAVERHGVIWAYMGARAEPPALPDLEVLGLPDASLRVFFAQRECNWLQALEGEIDTSHFSFLHFGGVEEDDLEPGPMQRFNVTDRSPRFALNEAPWGTMYGAYRPGEPGTHYWRIAHYLFPFWTMPPDGAFGGRIWARAWVPMDDTHTMFCQIAWDRVTEGVRKLKDGRPIPGLSKTMDYLPNDTGWYGRWRMTQNAGNDYGIDRDVQQTESYTGIEGLYMQDQAITESMGPIVDHTFEHLAPSDLMIIRTRKRLLDIARALAEHGTPPPGVDDPEVYRGARSGDFLLQEDADWLAHYNRRMAEEPDPTGLSTAAE